MPSERWKTVLLVVTTVLLCHLMGQADGTDGMQHPISMGADGWKPILGSNRSPTTHYPEEIKYYQNPILKETVKAEPLPTTTPGTSHGNSTRFEQKGMKTISINVVHPSYSKGKLPPHSKHAPQYFVLPNHGSHGPHIPLNSIMHKNPNQHGGNKNIGPKHHGHNSGKRIKKPGYGQMVAAHSTRNEVYVPAPSPGSYSFFSQGKNVKTRESGGQANEGQKLYTVKHPHIEFSSHFPPNNLYQQANQPIQHIIFQKQQVNEVIPSYQVDNMQNLSPPPIFKNFAEVKQRPQQNINPEIRTPNEKVIFGHNPLGPNDLILQLPSYDLFGFGKQRVQNSGNVQVNREKLQPYTNYQSQNFIQVEGEFGHINHGARRPVTDYPKVPTYEVTEGKWEENTSSSDHIQSNVELDVPPFLPTPYKPDKVYPTSATQNEVSTIFSQLSNAVRHHPAESYTRNSLFFDVKEVSTHYPILRRPGYIPTTEEAQEVTEKSSLRTSSEDIEKTTEWDQQTTEQPVRIQSQHRRRRPTTLRTTTSPSDISTDPMNVETTTLSNIGMDVETERPLRPKRPLRPRPGSSGEVHHSHRVRDRHRKRPNHSGPYRKRVRPNRFESEENTTNKPTEEPREEVTEVLPIMQYFTTQSLKDFDENQKDSSYPLEDQRENLPRRRPPNRAPSREADHDNDNRSGEMVTEPAQSLYISSYEIASQENDATLQNHESSKISLEDTSSYEMKNHDNVPTTTTEVSTIMTTVNIPDNEVEYTTSISEVEDQEIPKVTTTPETSTSSTSTVPTKSNRRRPIKYNASNRPRFSVKDYRQRLNQYSSTSTTSTEAPKPVSDNSVRLRFPTRLRRPLSTTSTTTQVYEESSKSKFIPKEPRYSSTHTANNEVITEKTIKAVNTRLRPFGRTKTTTESSASTMKISIKPNLFSNRRRPTMNPFKPKILNKTNDSDDKTDNPNESNNGNETTAPNEQIHEVNNTEEEIKTEQKEEEVTTLFPTVDILKNDAFAYSQRVSDLTSSMKDEYERFKAVPSSSRRVPNHYTISTEDPILPLEAFFSNINDKGK